MKISLYLVDCIMNFRLPEQVSGSFSFNDSSSDIKLINIEARNGKWILYSTSSVSVLNNGVVVDSVELIDNSFYILKRDGKSYLIYVNYLLSSRMIPYRYDNNIHLLIGNNDSCNIRYNCFYMNNLLLGIGYNGNDLILEKRGNIVIYINKKAVIENPTFIKNGDELEVYGLRMIFLNGVLFINNMSNLYVDCSKSFIQNFSILSNDEPQDFEIKDVDLYQKSDYASKAPRIRRVIETKDIKLSPPPKNDSESELPLILVIGPMFTMALVSVTTLFSTFSRIKSGQSSLSNSWPQLVVAFTMILSSLLWPLLTRLFNKKIKSRKKKEVIDKYTNYLNDKANELESERKLQKVILLENLISVDQCLDNIKSRNINFWSKRIDQNDFLVVRIGIGNELLDAKIQYPESGFSIEENELKEKADELIKNSKYIDGVPIGYSLYDNTISAVMGNRNKTVNFINNIILQLISFYSYEDLKFVVFTNQANCSDWEYIKYLNHCFSNDKSFRFFGTDYDSCKSILEYLNVEINNRINQSDSERKNNKPHYIILVDDYDKIKRYDFIESLTEAEENLGFSMIIVENRLSKLPSKCDNFITLNENESGILKNSYEKQEQIVFHDEIHYNIDMMDVARIVSNVPIEFEEEMKSLPNSITFLEMESVGKIEQLNILNRWNTNDSTSSLKCEVGVDEKGDLMYLDLHEKYHGPHGLIAGMTGSGKSEFIITYILSMCINYSPDDVSFILIDYKGGGLAFAFENKVTGVVLPHLAGTITNLDKAEMDRTLVSIDSEIKKRQYIFNEARDLLGESTIDIYKYQRFYKEGKLKEPIPHLFIICDEFAELKSQQPDFMDNLISVARIGRSLGVHLILATQKPSGVVNDQIWSNTKFRVCLKVQDESDSREMLKRTEAAYLKQAGRFYLQVGYDEFFALGQSAWCGAKYYPSDSIVKNVDKSINFIDDCGFYLKSIQASNSNKVQPSGEQLANILSAIVDVSNQVSKKARRLWLDNIPEVILIDQLEKKYNFNVVPYNVKCIIGEYDAPEKQQQGVIVYDFLKDGNTIIYGNDGSEREMLLDSIIYSSCKNYSSSELNYYIIDYGSESLRRYSKLPHIGGIVYLGEDEEYVNLFKMLRKEIASRKKLFADYGGDYSNYIKSSNTKLPIKVIILNNYDSIYENNPELYDSLPDLVRDSERYGIVFIVTCNAINSVQNRISQNFHNLYAFKLKDEGDYSSIFGTRVKTVPRDIFGRGLIKHDVIHEFQVASILENNDGLNDFISQFIDNQVSKNNVPAVSIPTLPHFVRLNDVVSSIDGLSSISVGIEKNSLNVATIDLVSNLGLIVTANRLENTSKFVNSFSMIINGFSNMDFIVFDVMHNINISNLDNYYTEDFSTILDKLISYLKTLLDSKSDNYGVILINGFSKFISSVDDSNKISMFFDLLKRYEKIGVIICDGYSAIKKYSFESWFTNIFNVNYGLWIGRGISDQNLLHLASVTRDMTVDYKNCMGYVVNEGYASLVKFIDFVSDDYSEDEDGE